MRTSFVIFVIFTQCIIKLSAQHQLHGDEFWAYSKDYSYPVPPGGCYVDTWKFYELRGDTLISGQTWFKLYSSYYQHTVCSSPASDNTYFVLPALSGWIRQDVNVWHYRAIDSLNAKILYDFDLQLGDLCLPGQACLVEKIDTTFGASAHITFRQTPPLFNSFATTVIEGIGAQYSYLNEPVCFSCFSVECATAIMLRCFRQHGSVEFSASPNDCATAQIFYQKVLDSATSGTTFPENQPDDAASIAVNPNPGTDQLQVEIQSPGQDDEFVLQIFDARNALVTSKICGNGLNQIDCAGWPSGIYYLHFTHPGNGFSRWEKWIRQ